jgi:hypothetical protein
MGRGSAIAKGNRSAGEGVMPDAVTQTAPTGNGLPAALPRAEDRRLLPHLESVALPDQEVLYRSGKAIRFVFFPDGGLISLLAGVGNSTFAEAGMVGREGLVGIPVYLGRDTTPFRTVVQVPGQARRMDVGAFRAEVRRAGALSRLLAHYVDAFLTHVSQVAACNSRHAVERRCCRWPATAWAPTSSR